MGIILSVWGVCYFVFILINYKWNKLCIDKLRRNSFLKKLLTCAFCLTTWLSLCITLVTDDAKSQLINNIPNYLTLPCIVGSLSFIVDLFVIDRLYPKESLENFF